VVNTGVITAIFGLLTLFTVCRLSLVRTPQEDSDAIPKLVALPDTQIYTAAYFPICPLYCNTILANLNVRAYLRSQGPIMELPLSPMPTTSNPATLSKNDTLVRVRYHYRGG